MKKLFTAVAAFAVTAVLVVPATGAGAQTSTNGVTKDDITLGVTYVDLKAIRDVVQLDHGDYEAAYNAIADNINKNGGVNGRKLKLVFAPVNPIGSTPAEEACVKLTEDTKSFAVVGFLNNDAPLCYVEQHGTPVVGGKITSEYLARAKAPWYSPNASDGTVNQIIDGFAAEGLFKGAKVGVIGSSKETAITDTVVRPALDRNKVKYSSAVLDASGDDPVAAEQRAGIILEKMKSDGVDTIVVSGGSFVTIAQALEKTDYRPRLVATDRETYLGYVKNPQHSKSVLAGAVSGGPARNFDDPTYQKDCIDVIEKATGTTIVAAETITDTKAPNPEVSAQNACWNLGLFTSLAKVAGKNLTTASFGKAGKKIGPFELPGYGTVTYDPKTHALSLPIKLTRYDAAQDASVDDAQPVATKAAK